MRLGIRESECRSGDSVVFFPTAASKAQPVNTRFARVSCQASNDAIIALIIALMASRRSSCCRSLGLSELGGLGSTRLKLSALYDLFEELAVAAAVISFALSIGLYVAAHRRGAKLADAAGTVGRSVMYDFFIGRELNPRIGPVDLKFFCELRPGLIGWVVINLGMLLKQKEMQGYVSASMIMVNVFQGLYVWDSLFFERAILTTMDITTEGFGFMLAFGDLGWVPFTYSLQAHYLVTNDPQLPLWAVGLISCLCLAGYAIFR